jgi:hypothetical protein
VEFINAWVQTNAEVPSVLHSLRYSFVHDNFKYNTNNILFLFIIFPPHTQNLRHRALVQGISNIYELQNMRDDMAGMYELVNDIDASGTATWNEGKGFEPVGSRASGCFSGKFNGNHHKITRLTIDRPDENLVGLFGCASHAEFQDVGVVDADITGKSFVGALAGYLIDQSRYGLLASRCFSSGNINGGWSVGGLFGFIYDLEIADCFSSADVHGYGEDRGGGRRTAAGGLVGDSNFSIIRNSYATGAVQGADGAGGLVGYLGATDSKAGAVFDCFATGPVTVTAPGILGGVGGLIGWAFYPGYVQFNTSYWYDHPDGHAVDGVGTGVPSIPVEVFNVAVFYDNANPPLTQWDFDNVWLFQNEPPDDYPILQREEPVAVPLDVMPGSCDNPLNPKSKGVLPVAILGTSLFEVEQLDPDTIYLYIDNAGGFISPVRHAFEDVATPYDPFLDKPLSQDGCTTVGPDGYQDLTLNFDRQQFVGLLSWVRMSWSSSARIRLRRRYQVPAEIIKTLSVLRVAYVHCLPEFRRLHS